MWRVWASWLLVFALAAVGLLISTAAAALLAAPVLVLVVGLALTDRAADIDAER